MGDLPDWTRATLLQGETSSGDVITLLVGDDGQLYAYLVGEDSVGTLHPVRTDTTGQLIIKLVGVLGVPLGVDTSGYLTAVLKGEDGVGALQTVSVDTSGQLVMVPRGQSGYYMNVDSDGYLTMILKGAENGVLTTIAVDAEGRIEAFILDAEDQWGGKVKVGNAELAGRLGALKTWDWRGQVAWQTDFGCGSGNILKYPIGNDSAITIDPVYWVTGGYSLKMVGGDDGDHKAYIIVPVETPASVAIGLEAQFSYVSNMEFFKLQVQCYTGGKIYIAGVRHNRTTNNVQYLNSSNVWTNIANPYYWAGPEMFHRLKFAVDFSTARYIRVLYASTEVDLSAQEVYQSGTGFLSALNIEVELNSRDGENDIAYLDSLILTTKEA